MASRPRNPSQPTVKYDPSEPTVRYDSPVDEYDDAEPSIRFPPSPRSHSSGGFRNSQFIRRLTLNKLSPAQTEAPFPRPQRRGSFRKFDDGPGPHGLICVHSPPEPLVELIFVHGLHGGSYKTWRKRDSEGFFWPGEWLPNDFNFRDVRIFTFGYPADWSDFKARGMSINDFANSLRASLIGSPELCARGEKTPIIFVGHSMGGLVIKRACVAFQRAAGAGQDPLGANLAQRIKCLMFLGTPHHGSDSAERLDKILRSGANPISSKAYVGELRRETLSNQSANDDFKFIADHYGLYSFFETIPTLGLGGLVVAKDSACMNGPIHEITQAMESNHRNICKFDSDDDPNYMAIRGHLVAIINDLIDSEEEPSPDQLDDLEVYLDCEGSQKDTKDGILDEMVEDSCAWLQHRDEFTEWIDSDDPITWLYWLHGPPGTGKSSTSAYVTSMLDDQDYAYFFFVNGEKFHRTVASLLRFLACQMAKRHKMVEEALRMIQRSRTHLEDADEKTIWKKLFVNCIFKLHLGEPQFWVIDALDECKDFTKLFPLLKGAQPSFPLRIFLTSRTTGEIRSLIQKGAAPKLRISQYAISPEDTESDIKRLLEAHEHDIPSENEEERAAIVAKILENAHGSFLWTHIVLREMQDAFTEADISRILDDVPEEMLPHYQTILDQMTANHPTQKPLIQAILTWAVCGGRPLTEQELKIALLWDIDQSISQLPRAIDSLCGQLVKINKQGVVQVTHSTVREFLLNRKIETDYSIQRDEGNYRLAKACLQYLCSKDMHPQNRHTTIVKSKQTFVYKVKPFADYASALFSLHLVRSPADSEEIFGLLLRFLRSPNVLFWIEYSAEKFKSLEHIKEAGANIRRYMERRSKHVAPIGPEFTTVNNWGVDLLRVVSKFGRHIMAAPPRMHLLVPPICPRGSSIFKQFSARNRDLKVVGISDEIWADAISYIEHPDAVPTRMACGTDYIAIGYVSGSVRLFHAETYAELISCSHGEAVTSMAFDNSGQHLVTSGSTTAKFWDLTDNSEPPREVWSRELGQRCLDFFFSDDDEKLVATSEDTSLLNIPLDGEDDLAWPQQLPNRPAGTPTSEGQGSLIPTSTSFSPDGRLVAFAYPSQPIYLWNVGEDEATFFADCGRMADSSQSKAEVQSILFNPNPDLEYLVVTYKEGLLALIDYHTREEFRAIEAEPYYLSSTPDGRTLATGDARGSIQLWDFETLTILYRINYHSQPVTSLVFSRDGRRLIDIREVHSVVWEPAALIRVNDEEDSRSTSGTSISYKAAVVEDYEDPIEISSIATHALRDEAVVGKDDGSVSVYELKTGLKLKDLFVLTPDKPVTHIVLSKDYFIVCADATGKAAVTSRDNDGMTQPGGNNPIQTFDFGEAVQQVLFSGSGKNLLIVGGTRGQVWQLDRTRDGEPFVLSSRFETPVEDCWRFFPCTDDLDQFQLVDKRVDEFDDHDSTQSRQDSMLSSASSFAAHRLCIRRVVQDPETGYLMVEYEGARSRRHLVILERTPFPSAPPADPTHLAPPTSPPIASQSVSDSYRLLLHLQPYQCRMFLGLYSGKAVYLGPRLWIRTVDLHHLTYGSKPVKKKHFFIPHEYIGGNHKVQARIGAQGEVVFPRRGELAVIRGGDVLFSETLGRHGV